MLAQISQLVVGEGYPIAASPPDILRNAGVLFVRPRPTPKATISIGVLVEQGCGRLYALKASVRRTLIEMLSDGDLRFFAAYT